MADMLHSALPCVLSRMEGQGPFQLLIDPVYGPQSKYFWPGSCWEASCYVVSPVRISLYVSGKDFLQIYAGASGKG